MKVLIVAGDRTGWPAWRNAAMARSSKFSDFIAQEAGGSIEPARRAGTCAARTAAPATRRLTMLHVVEHAQEARYAPGRRRIDAMPAES
jgi:hypothetical protein